MWAIVLMLAILFVLTPRENGRWQCSLCGKHERRQRVMFVTLRTTPNPSPYYDWFVQNDDRSHAHDWMAVGCHNDGNFIMGTISCTGLRMNLQEEIPGQANPLKAVDKLFSLSRDQRYREFMEFRGDVSPGSTGYVQWWSEHPQWNGIFAPPPRKEPDFR